MKSFLFLLSLSLTAWVAQAQNVRLRVTRDGQPQAFHNITISHGDFVIGRGQTDGSGNASINCNGLRGRAIDVAGERNSGGSNIKWSLKGVVVLDNGNYAHIQLEQHSKMPDMKNFGNGSSGGSELGRQMIDDALNNLGGSGFGNSGFGNDPGFGNPSFGQSNPGFNTPNNGGGSGTSLDDWAPPAPPPPAPPAPIPACAEYDPWAGFDQGQNNTTNNLNPGNSGGGPTLQKNAPANNNAGNNAAAPKNAPAGNSGMNASAFQSEMQNIRNTRSAFDKRDKALALARSQALSSAQVAELMDQVSSPFDQKDLALAAFPRCTDPQNFREATQKIKSSITRREVEDATVNKR